jgi:hypothetical protein
MNYAVLVKVTDTSHSLTETEHPLKISESLSMAFVAEAHRAEGHFRFFKFNIKQTEVSKISIRQA